MPTIKTRKKQNKSANKTKNENAHEISGAAGMYSFRRALQVLCLIAIVAVGVGLRASVWSAWENAPQHGFYKGLPVLRECDGYHYLALARDIKEGTYGQSKDKADVLGSRSSPHPPPFLSLLAAGVSRVTGASLEWCAAWIPVVLGALGAFALYLLGVAVDGWVAGIVAGILGTMAPLWVYRTGFAFFDTDCLIVPLSLWIAWSAFGLREGRWSRVLRYGAVWAGLSVLLLWSWDTNTVVVAYISAVPAVLSLLTRKGDHNRTKLWLVLCGGVLLAVALVNYGGLDPLEQIKNLANIVFANKRSPFPSPSLFISEMERHDIGYIARMTSGSVLGFVLGILGFAVLMRNKWRYAIVLLPLASIGGLTFFSGQRFIIFATPILALGIGVLVSAVWRRYNASHWRWVAPATAVVLIGLTWLNEIPTGVIWPFVHPAVMEGIEEAGKLSPENSLIWCGWSVGYPVAYLSRRTPVADGGIGDGQTLVANSIPLATESFRLSANWIQFYANRREQGLTDFWSRSGGPGEKLSTLKEALAAGPSGAEKVLVAAGLHEPPEGSQSWESFLFPQSKRRIFLFLDFHLLRSFDGWYRPGTWSPDYPWSEQPGAYLIFQGIRGTGQNISGVDIVADLQNGIAQVGSERVNLSELFLRNSADEIKRKYRESGLRLEVYLPGGLAVLTLPKLTNSVFHKLFVRHQTDSRYFKPVLLNSPMYQIWEVTGDSPVQ